MSNQEIKEAIQQSIQELPFADRIERIRLFGSYLHHSAGSDSDIDLLVDFNKPVSFFQLGDIEDELERTLGRKVDVVTPKALSKHFRDDVLREAETMYER
ncbi:MAG: nucleotidyltransferase family protein [Candidatus Andersenbacteria bacterium]